MDVFVMGLLAFCLVCLVVIAVLGVIAYKHTHLKASINLFVSERRKNEK